MKKPSHRTMTSESPMYVYATEMVSAYYGKLDIKNKRVLSIVGSGDQIINAYFFGAKEVVGFDINKYSFFMLELKASAIINLTYAEFIKFFGKDMGEATLDFGLYNKLKKNLSPAARKFFDRIYEEFDGNGKKLFKSDYFRQRSMLKYSVFDINAYLKSEKNYLRCRDIMQEKDLQFIELDINDILKSKKIKGRFDVINLSNVLNYLTGNSKENEYAKVLANATKNVSKKIKKGGVFFTYSYDPGLYKNKKTQIPPASRQEMISEIKKINKFKISVKKFKGTKRGVLDRINVFRAD